MKFVLAFVRVLACVRVLALLLLTATGAARADDRADLERTRIVGNRELPKVLYIVPWKKPAPGDLTGRPMQSILDEALAPIDRDVFRRQVRYDTQRTAPATGGEDTPAPTAPASGVGQR